MINSGILFDTLDGQGLDNADVNPQAIDEKLAHLRRGDYGNASLRDDLIGQRFFRRCDQKSLSMIPLHPDHAGLISLDWDLTVDKKPDRRAEFAGTARRD